MTELRKRHLGRKTTFLVMTVVLSTACLPFGVGVRNDTDEPVAIQSSQCEPQCGPPPQLIAPTVPSKLYPITLLPGKKDASTVAQGILEQVYVTGADGLPMSAHVCP